MTVTDPVTRTGSESAETATDVVASGAPASPAGPWPLLAVGSLWAFVQAGWFGLITVVLTLYIWTVKLTGPVGRFARRRLTHAGRAFGRWCGGRGRSGRRGKLTRTTWRRIRVVVWLVLGGLLGWTSWALGFATPVEAVRDGLTFAALGFVPGLARAGFALVAPRLYARFDGWTLRNGQRAWVRERWEDVAHGCGLVVHDRNHNPVCSKVKTSAAPGVVKLRIQAQSGQTVQDIIDAAGKVATDYRAYDFDVTPAGPGVVWLRLFLHNALTAGRNAVLPSRVELDAVTAGLRLDGAPFRLVVRGRHTLVAGASNSGKGSAFWSIVGGLAPAVAEGLVCLWGIDMKKGVEIGMGPQVFHATAYTHADAIAVLQALTAVIERRGTQMRGKSRNFEPVPGDPVHVLLVDELADLVAYSDFEIRREADRLLSIILTQGRALGVVACAFVQNPRQDAVGQRNLWTQKVALRLDTEQETGMVLDSRARQAPAHLINPNGQGTGYLVNEDGTVSMVRFDYWPDSLIRQVAETFPAPTSAGELKAEIRDPLARFTSNTRALVAGLDNDDGADAPAGRPHKRTPRKNPRNRRPVADVPAPDATSAASATPSASSPSSGQTSEGSDLS